MSPNPSFNPFPGLRPFGIEEDYLFFGREEQVTELLALLREHRFVAVVGTSGSGKSSLVRAGLLPALHGGTLTKAGSSWEVVVMRPGEELIDPDTGLSLGSMETRVGEIEVVNNTVGDGKASQCKVLSGAGFERGDIVRLKD